MSSVFGRLNFDSSASSQVSNLSSNVTSTLDRLPNFMNSWQAQDVASSNTGGYFKNPVSNNIINLWNVSNNIIAIANISSINTSSIYSAAQQLFSAANSFFQHTNRLSGIDAIKSDTTELPHYETAVSTGKMVIYLTSQTDGIKNNAPIIGNFTSLFTSSNLVSYYSTISSYPQTIINSLNVDIEGNTTSNLTPQQITTIATQINNVSSFMNTKRTSDETFFTNCQNVVNDYNSIKQFTDLGDTETYLLNNFVGSDKLLSRLNS